MKDKTFRYLGWTAIVVFTVVCWWFMLKPAFAYPVKFQFGYHVETREPTNVVIRYKMTCSNDNRTKHTSETYEAETPVTGIVIQNMRHPKRCSIRVVSWDIPPWVGPHGDGDVPVVTTWLVKH